MPLNSPAHSRPAARGIPLLLVLATLLLTGCLRPQTYLDPKTKEIPVSEFKHVDQPKPVHMVVEFQTKGAPNARATTFVMNPVTEEVKASALFGLLDAPSGPDVALLSITINNVAVAGSEDAASKGFATGFTFGLVGTAVSDGYICTVSYLAPGRKEPVVKTARHMIHTTIGNASPPPDAIPMENSREAVTLMVRQILSHALHDLSVDAAF